MNDRYATDSAIVERALNRATDLIAATLAQPSDPRAWDQLLIYCPPEAIERHRASQLTITTGCICQEQHRRGYCTELGCQFAKPNEGEAGANDAIYNAVLHELETKRRMPTSVMLAVAITNAVTALTTPTRGKKCFWPRCSNRTRCDEYGSCVALAQREALAHFPEVIADEGVMEATAAQHVGHPKGDPVQFVRNGKLEMCQCRDCRSPPRDPTMDRW